MDFKEAYTGLLQSQLAKRAGWIDIYIEIIEADLFFSGINKFILETNATGYKTPWNITNVDLFATDWELIDDGDTSISGIELPATSFMNLLQALKQGETVKCEQWDGEAKMMLSYRYSTIVGDNPTDNLILISSSGEAVPYTINNYELLYGTWSLIN